jgi:hypothetical protein
MKHDISPVKIRWRFVFTHPNVKLDASGSEANGRSDCGVFKALLKRRAVSCLAVKRLGDDFLCWPCRSYVTCATQGARNAINIGPVMGWPSACVVWKNSTYFAEILRRNFVLIWWHTVTHGMGSEGETGEWSG